MNGKASDNAVIGLFGAVKETYEDTRLAWYSSRVPTGSSDVRRFLEVASSCYERHGFEYPVEMLFVTSNEIVAIQKVYPEEKRRILESLKGVLDPNSVISPGRYGIETSMPAFG